MQQHNHVLIVSMLSTSWNGYIKQTDIHLKPSVQPYHLILRSPLLICYQNDWSACRQMETQQLANVWNGCNSSNFSKWNYNRPTLSKNHPTKWKNGHRTISCLLVHHLAAEQKQDAIFLSSPVKKQVGSLWCFSTGYTSRWKRKLRGCWWQSALVTFPLNGPWLLAPWRTNPSKTCNVSGQ